MNQQILELAKQATINIGDEFHPIDFFDKEKFAELIVRECIRIDVENRDAAPGVEIAKYFGIEQ
jgi:hypothetical protein